MMNRGVRGKLAVGLWGHPAAIDFDYDGVMDLIVSCPDHPYNGTYLFHNIGTNAKPLFDRRILLQRSVNITSAVFSGCLIHALQQRAIAEPNDGKQHQHQCRNNSRSMPVAAGFSLRRLSSG